MISDFAKFDRPGQLFIGFQALDAFTVANKGALPRPRNEADAQQVLKLAKEINAECADGVKVKIVLSQPRIIG